MHQCNLSVNAPVHIFCIRASSTFHVDPPLPSSNPSDMLRNNWIYIQHLEGDVGRASSSEKEPERREWTGAERLGLRISEMINHPVAQIQRWVTIHQLDTDAQEDWDGMIELLAGIDGLDMTFNDDGTVTARWEKQESQDVVMVDYLGEDDSPLPF